MSIGEIFDGKVTAVMKYGCFVAFGDKLSGMVHISEVSNEFISDINDVIKIGDDVRIKVLKIDENSKISLSIKKTEPKIFKKREEDFHYTPKKKSINQNDLNFEDKLKMFMTNSQERLTDVKHNKEKKTGVRRKK